MACREPPTFSVPNSGNEIKQADSMSSLLSSFHTLYRTLNHLFLHEIINQIRRTHPGHKLITYTTAQIIQSLLTFYEIPFTSTMFLPDKKLLYLRFIGASGTLCHLVLD